MPDTVIPPEARLAARRAFVRTTAQAYSATLTVGLLTSVVSLILNPSEWITVLVAVILAMLAPMLAGLVAYFQWLAKGIPDAYAALADAEEEAAALALFKPNPFKANGDTHAQP